MGQIKGDHLVIRLSEIRDVRELIVLDNMIWTEDTTPGQLTWCSREDYLLHAPPGSQLVAVEDGVLCGYVGFGHPTGMESNRHVLEINIAVDPRFQRSGIGLNLMEVMKEMAAEKGIRKLRLRVLSCNSAAIAFYTRCGFQEEGRLREEFFLGGRYVDALFMSLALTKDELE